VSPPSPKRRAEKRTNVKKSYVISMRKIVIKVLPLITATALSVAIWGFFAVWIVIVFEKSYDLITVIAGSLLMLVFAGSTTWDSIREWGKMRDENKK